MLIGRSGEGRKKTGEIGGVRYALSKGVVHLMCMTEI